MKTSFIVTILNEEKTIEKLLDSLRRQTQMPDEIIITDGGSSDRTVDKIKKFVKKYHLKIILLEKKGNRAIGRNYAIEHATHEIILCSDAGCFLDKDWVKNIVKPFIRPNIDVVAGYYKGIGKTILEKCIIPFALVMPDKVNPVTFLPATRSMAFRKTTWKDIGEFDEKLSHNEDYAFSKKLQQTHKNIFFMQDAIVQWYPPQTLRQFAKMIYRFALGDAEAKLFRPKVLLIFIRYFIVLVLLINSFFYHPQILLLVLVVLFGLYIAWSIKKNYRYVREPSAYFYLSVLQIVSDIAVMSGTIAGLFFLLFRYAKENKIVALVFIGYILATLSQITWGIPNPQHPFPYHMDEWHQYLAVRETFRHGSPNVPGAAHGSMLQFILSGIYLLPFILLHIVNPFALHSFVQQLNVQEKLFIILRLNTLLFGLGTMIVMLQLGKKIFHLPKALLLFLFTITPIWIMLSNYFKYDIALLFWITLSVYYLCKTTSEQTKKNILLTGFFIGCAFATKLSAIALLPSYALLLFFLRSKGKKQIWMGILMLCLTFLFLGIPDIFFHVNEYYIYIFSNLHTNPIATSSALLPQSLPDFMLTSLYPALFGHVFYIVALIGFVLFLILRAKNNVDRMFLCTFLFFTLSLSVLGLEANGNRTLVLLPFLAVFATYAFSQFFHWNKTIGVACLIVVVIIQSIETVSWLQMKWQPDPRQVSSLWLDTHLSPKTTIGIENVPIYQYLPDKVIKDFYEQEEQIHSPTQFTYTVIAANKKTFPKVVLVSNATEERNLFPTSDKIALLNQLKTRNYHPINIFSIPRGMNQYFVDDRVFYWSNLDPLRKSASILGKIDRFNLFVDI